MKRPPRKRTRGRAGTLSLTHTPSLSYLLLLHSLTRLFSNLSLMFSSFGYQLPHPRPHRPPPHRHPSPTLIFSHIPPLFPLLGKLLLFLLSSCSLFPSCSSLSLVVHTHNKHNAGTNLHYNWQLTLSQRCRILHDLLCEAKLSFESYNRGLFHYAALHARKSQKIFLITEFGCRSNTEDNEPDFNSTFPKHNKTASTKSKQLIELLSESEATIF